MQYFSQQLINGLSLGSIYALIAVGYTMVYGVLQLINFAHGDVFMVGAVVCLLAARFFGFVTPEGTAESWVAFAACTAVAILACGVLGFAIERLAYRPLRRAPRLNVLITAIGVSLFLQNVGQLRYVFGASPENMPRLLPQTNLFTFTFGEVDKVLVKVSLVDGIIFATAAVLMLMLQFLVYRTKLGRAMRAISFDPDAAALMGVPVDRVISFTFVLGSALAAAAGFLYVLKYPSLKHPGEPVWVMLGLKAFVAAVIGGIGNVRGAVLGGFVIAFVEQFGSYYVSAAYRDVYVFAVLILILLVKPTGILGSPIQDKV